MKKWEITIRCNENEENNRVFECDECLVMGIREDEDGKLASEAQVATSVDHLSKALAKNGFLVASARHAVAHADSMRDMAEEEAHNKMKMLTELLGKGLAADE